MDSSGFGLYFKFLFWSGLFCGVILASVVIVLAKWIF